MRNAAVLTILIRVRLLMLLKSSLASPTPPLAARAGAETEEGVRANEGSENRACAGPAHGLQGRIGPDAGTALTAELWGRSPDLRGQRCTGEWADPADPPDLIG